MYHWYLTNQRFSFWVVAWDNDDEFFSLCGTEVLPWRGWTLQQGEGSLCCRRFNCSLMLSGFELWERQPGTQECQPLCSWSGRGTS